MAEIQTLEEKVPVNATVSQPNFTGAMTNLASSPSVAAQVGAQVASAATNRLMQEKGLELGKDPQGNLPVLPINDYLKQLETSYNAQAQATLSLRAQQVINEANEEMAKNPALSTEDIQGYKQTLQDTLGDISKLAPTGVRENLKNSFDSTLQSNTHQYVLKMNERKRKEAANTQEVYIDSQFKNMQELAINGDDYGAEDAYGNAMAQLDDRLAARDMTAQEHAAKIRELDIVYQQSKMLNEALAAEKKDKLEKYLAAMPDKKPTTMSFADYSVAMAGVSKAMAQREQAKSSNRSMMISEAITNSVLTGQPPSVQQTTALKDQLTTQQFNETMLRINSALTQKTAKMTAEDKLYADRMSGEAWYEANPKAQKVVFDKMTAEEQALAEAKGQGISEIQAMTNVAKKIPIAVRPYQDRLNQRISSGSAQEALEAAFAYQAMSGGDFQDASKVSSLDEKAKVAAAMMNLNASNDLSPEEKVSLARNAAYNRTTEQSKAIENSYARFKQENLSTPSDIRKFVKEVTGTVDTSLVHEASSLNDDILATHKKFYELAGSNEEVANQLTQEYVNNHYGYTNINGTQEYVLNPLERVAGRLSSSSIPLIHEDAVNQLNEQLKLNNERYAQGLSDVHYEVQMPTAKDGTPLTYENYYTLLNESQKSGNGKEARDAVEKFNSFRDQYYSPKTVMVKVTRRNSGEEMAALNFYPSRSMQQSSDHNTIGGFEVGLRGKNGLLVPFTSWIPGNIDRIHYQANVGEITQRAGSMPMYQYSPEAFEQKTIARNRFAASMLANRRF